MIEFKDILAAAGGLNKLAGILILFALLVLLPYRQGLAPELDHISYAVPLAMLALAAGIAIYVANSIGWVIDRQKRKWDARSLAQQQREDEERRTAEVVANMTTLSEDEEVALLWLMRRDTQRFSDTNNAINDLIDKLIVSPTSSRNAVYVVHDAVWQQRALFASQRLDWVLPQKLPSNGYGREGRHRRKEA